MNGVQSTFRDAMLDRVSRVAEFEKLCASDQPVLALGEPPR
jgi:hypothetical protein